tara:strand:- start:1126 stop:1236 length:111 start_codon:yes stop_codon:yes gene_type:complete
METKIVVKDGKTYYFIHKSKIIKPEIKKKEITVSFD